MERRASLHTVGCRLNQAETAIFSHQLRTSGFHVVPFGEPTDLFILNTCSVTHGAEADCRRAIRRTLERSPNAFVAVTGCYAQTGLSQSGDDGAGDPLGQVIALGGIGTQVAEG